MARTCVSLTVGSTLLEHERFDSVGHTTDAVNASGTATDKAAVAAAIAVLVADGASPTQAHVNTLNTAWTALSADISPVPSAADVVLSVNTTNVVTKTVLRRAVQALLQIVEGSSDLTP